MRRDQPSLALAYNPPLRVPPLGVDGSGRSYWVAQGRLFRTEGGVLAAKRGAGLEGASAALLRNATAGAAGGGRGSKVELYSC